MTGKWPLAAIADDIFLNAALFKNLGEFTGVVYGPEVEERPAWERVLAACGCDPAEVEGVHNINKTGISNDRRPVHTFSGSHRPGTPES